MKEMEEVEENNMFPNSQRRAPPRKMDPEVNAQQQKVMMKNKKEYQKIYLQMSSQKQQYLDRLNASVKYRNQSSGTNPNQSTTKFQFCSSGIKEQQTLMNKQMLTQDILCRKEGYTKVVPLGQNQSSINLSNIGKTIQNRDIMAENKKTELFKSLQRDSSLQYSRAQSRASNTRSISKQDVASSFVIPRLTTTKSAMLQSKMSSGSIGDKKNVSQYLALKQETQSKWVPIKKVQNLFAEDQSMQSTEYGGEQIQIREQNTQSRNVQCRSTLGGKRNIIPLLEQKNQAQVMNAYHGLNKSYLANSIQQLEKMNSSVSFARIKLKQSTYVEPPFKVHYDLKVPDALKQKVNRQYLTFCRDVLEELEPVKALAVEDYQGTVSKGVRGGQGMVKLANGDLYKGNFKNGKRHGSGVCMFKSGALYKGDFNDDQIHGQGILYSGKNEIIECRFEHGQVPNNGRVRIMLQDGSYYDGAYSNHRRHGLGICYYPNGEMFEGSWQADKRIGRGKMRFTNGSLYQGQFIADKADGNGQIEDVNGNFFQVEQGVEDGARDAGCIINGRLQNRCSITFINGDKFIGTFKDGRPNGYGILHYKNSVPSTNTNSEFEVAQYYGNFFQGRREGKGKMIWADGTVFEGQWKNDLRHHGRLIMNNGFVYIGGFKRDKFNDDNATLLMPNMTIYKGGFTDNKTHPLCMLLYPSGEIYYGQHSQYVKQGCGKVISFGGGFYEGFWEQDKIHGNTCRIYDDQTGDLFVGQLDEGKKMGQGRLYSAETDEVYEGLFENDKRSGQGTIYRRNGEVCKGDFRNGFMEGPYEVVATLSKAQVDRVFNNAQRQGDLYYTVNKKSQEKLTNMLRATAGKNMNPFGSLRSPKTPMIKSSKKIPNIDIGQV